MLYILHLKTLNETINSSIKAGNISMGLARPQSVVSAVIIPTMRYIILILHINALGLGVTPRPYGLGDIPQLAALVTDSMASFHLHEVLIVGCKAQTSANSTFQRICSYIAYVKM